MPAICAICLEPVENATDTYIDVNRFNKTHDHVWEFCYAFAYWKSYKTPYPEADADNSLNWIWKALSNNFEYPGFMPFYAVEALIKNHNRFVV